MSLVFTRNYKTLNLGPVVGIYWDLNFQKAIVIFQINTFNFIKLQKKTLHLWLKKNHFLCIWDSKFGKKIIVTFKISTIKFSKIQNFMQKKKPLNFEPTIPTCVFLDWNLKQLLLYWNHFPQIWKMIMQKFTQNKNFSNLG